MTKLYIVLWKGSSTKWGVDGVYTDRAIADAKMVLERLEHPGWRHEVVEVEVEEEPAK